MEDVNLEQITLQDCLDNYNMRNRIIEINDGRVINIKNDKDCIKNG